MSTYPAILSHDANNVPIQGLWDMVSHAFVDPQAGTVLTDGNILSAPQTIQQVIQYLVMAGKGFRVTTGQVATGAANVYLGLQMAVNNLSVNVLIYNIYVSCNASTSDIRLYQGVGTTTTDADLTVSLTGNILNQVLGSATTTAIATLNGSPAAATAETVISGAGTQVMTMAASGNTTQNLLQNGSVILLPKGSQNTVATYAIEGTSGNKIAITFEWIEF